MELISGYTFEKRFFSSKGTGKFVIELPVNLPLSLNDLAEFIYEELLPGSAAYGVELDNIKGLDGNDNAPLFIVQGEVYVDDEECEDNKILWDSWCFSWHTSYVKTRSGSGTLVYKVKRLVEVPDGFPEHLGAALKWSGSIVKKITFSGECFTSACFSRLVGQASVLQFRWLITQDSLHGGYLEFTHFDNAVKGEFPVPKERNREKFIKFCSLVGVSLAPIAHTICGT